MNDGYTVTSAYTAVKDPVKTKFYYRDQLWAGADLLGMGVASFSHVGGVHFQNQHNFDPYMEKLQAGELPIYRALTPTRDERIIRELILQFKLGYVKPRYFQEKFGIHIREMFAKGLAKINETGFLTDDGDELRLSIDGMLHADRLVHEFFLPQHKDARYA